MAIGFDPQNFAAEAVLGMILTDRLPRAAQKALEAGFGGRYLTRMAVLEADEFWEIDRVLPLMLAELGLKEPTKKEAALRLACVRAERIFATGEDPLESISYFHQLLVAADYPC